MSSDILRNLPFSGVYVLFSVLIFSIKNGAQPSVLTPFLLVQNKLISNFLLESISPVSSTDFILSPLKLIPHPLRSFSF